MRMDYKHKSLQKKKKNKKGVVLENCVYKERIRFDSIIQFLASASVICRQNFPLN